MSYASNNYIATLYYKLYMNLIKFERYILVFKQYGCKLEFYFYLIN